MTRSWWWAHAWTCIDNEPKLMGMKGVVIILDRHAPSGAHKQNFVYRIQAVKITWSRENLNQLPEAQQHCQTESLASVSSTDESMSTRVLMSIAASVHYLYCTSSSSSSTEKYKLEWMTSRSARFWCICRADRWSRAPSFSHF